MIDLAEIKDLVIIMEMIKEAQEEMRSEQNPQWGSTEENYPNQEMIANDIQNKNLYVKKENNQIQGMIVITDDNNYYDELLKNSHKKAYILHRLVVPKEYRKLGLAMELLSFAENLAKEKGIEVLKADTEQKNTKMNNLFFKMGYSKIGEFEYDDYPGHYLYYEKLVKKKIIEQIANQNYETLTFEPFLDYINTLEEENYTLLKAEAESNWRELIYYNGKEYLKILIFTDTEQEWFSIYKFQKEHCNYMQLEFMIFTKEGVQFYNTEYNRVIKYAAYTIEEQYAKLIVSGYTYHNNQYDINSGWRRKRKIKKEDLKYIITLGMNLQELILRADTIKSNYPEYITEYECIDEKAGEVKKLKLTYDE